MKKLFSLVLLSLSCIGLMAGEQWSADELAKANTAASVSQLTQEEKDVIKYINLARLYPQKFVRVEFADYYTGKKSAPAQNSYEMGLIAELHDLAACQALTFSQQMYSEATCWAIPMGQYGIVGHNRESYGCSDSYGGECCSYGYSRALDIVLQLLIDDGVPSLGHRQICLNPGYNAIGVKIAPHSIYDYCCCLDFSWGNYSNSRNLKYASVPDDVYRAICNEMRGLKGDDKKEDKRLISGGDDHQVVINNNDQVMVDDGGQDDHRGDVYEEYDTPYDYTNPATTYCTVQYSDSARAYLQSTVHSTRSLTGDNGVPLDFPRLLDLLNYMGQQGWTFVPYNLTENSRPAYIFSRPVDTTTQAASAAPARTGSVRHIVFPISCKVVSK